MQDRPVVASPGAISQNLAKLYDITKTRPFPIFRNASSYGAVDYAFLRTTIFVSLYTPYSAFPPLADALTELSKGNAAPLWDYGIGIQTTLNVVSDPEIVIACNDGNLIPGTVEDAEQYFKQLAKTSDWADTWAGDRLFCA